MNTRDCPPSGAWLLLEGTCELEQEGKKLKGNTGDWIFLRPGPRRQKFSRKCRLLSIGFMARWPHGTDALNTQCSLRLKGSRIEELTPAAWNLVHAINHHMGTDCDWKQSRMWRDALTPEAYMVINGRFMDWLGQFIVAATESGAQLHAFTSRDGRVDTAIHIVENWPLEEPFHADVVAMKVDLSRRRLDQLFKAETGQSIQAWYERMHLRRICRLLLDDRRQIKEIAHTTGFEHASNFSRWFQGRMGMTPMEFRAARSHVKGDPT